MKNEAQVTETIQNIEEESVTKEIDKNIDEVPENKVEVSQSTENKDTYNDYLNRLIDAKKSDCENAYIVGRILRKAKTSLTPKEYYKLLNDKRIKYRRTQAEKYINFADRVDECHTCGRDIISLGVEKTYRISKLDKENQHHMELEDFTMNNPEITVRKLDRIVKKMNEESELTPEQAWDEVQNEPKNTVNKERKSVPIEEYNKLKENSVSTEEYNKVLSENKKLKDEIETLKCQQNSYKTNYPEQKGISNTFNMDSFVQNTIPTVKQPILLQEG